MTSYIVLKRESGALESPGYSEPSQGDPSLGTPASSVTPRPRSGLHRTPLGARNRCNTRFKSPVYSVLNNSPAAGASECPMENAVPDLKRQHHALDEEITQLKAEGYSVSELEEHITLLHQYNELKDAGQMLLGKLAVIRHVTTKDLYAEFGLDLED
ncbi:DNA repair protein SWI5 homolog [Bombina bombina]|uniref:DNA repair protein SWI5 homolog n=1 Tax=Bombina bombina TaxID=8345 RepID=UPI00235B1C3D|nr:DNA repair protein SWI5 homolog [Bombina bombina]